MQKNTPTCIQCGQSDQSVPLLQFQYQDKQFWICPQDLPILIHKPAQLADKLPGLELVHPSGGHP